MRLVHKIMLLLPIILVWYWLFCVVFLLETKFYYENYAILDIIDSVIVGFSGLHFLFFHFIYTRISKIYLSCIYSLVILNFLYIYLTDFTYYFLYHIIILTYILLPFWKKKK